jgi:predicted nucleic acid-binding protein
MTKTLVDSSVLLDLITPGPARARWSKDQLDAADARQGVGLNLVVWAEVASAFRDGSAMALLENESFLQRYPIPWEAAELAGVAHREYRKRGGVREVILPDFLIAAHAAYDGLTLLTRDVRRARTAFSNLKCITPESP